MLIGELMMRESELRLDSLRRPSTSGPGWRIGRALHWGGMAQLPLEHHRTDRGDYRRLAVCRGWLRPDDEERVGGGGRETGHPQDPRMDPGVQGNQDLVTTFRWYLRTDQAG